MSKQPDPKLTQVITQYIDQNLKEVFDGYANEDMPTEILDLLSVLKAQDQELDQK